MTNKLPPLPEPEGYERKGLIFDAFNEDICRSGYDKLYMASQMQAYGQQCREQAIEEAALSLLEAGFRSTGIPAYESLAERVRKLK